MVVAGPLTARKVMRLLIETAEESTYVPFVTSTVSPSPAASTAIWMIVAAVAQFV
jgi:hypothetical protein